VYPSRSGISDRSGMFIAYSSAAIRVPALSICPCAILSGDCEVSLLLSEIFCLVSSECMRVELAQV